jgi:rfaE bifunctional protein kinase chain/domain
VRIDYEHPHRLTRELETKILNLLEERVPEVGAVVVSDYSLGTLSPEIRAGVIAMCRNLDVPLVVDSRDHTPSYLGANTVTPNITEVEAAIQARIGTDPSALEEQCMPLLSAWDVEALLVTRGKLGMSLFNQERSLHIPPFGSDEVVDVSGAGDTVAATYAAGLAAGASYAEAARIANYSGGLVVMKKGTAQVPRSELEEAITRDLSKS